MAIGPDDAAGISGERVRRRGELLAFLAAHDVVCPGCGYGLRGLTGVQCPECGWVFALRELRRQVEPREPLVPRRRGGRGVVGLGVLRWRSIAPGVAAVGVYAGAVLASRLWFGGAWEEMLARGLLWSFVWCGATAYAYERRDGEGRTGFFGRMAVVVVLAAVSAAIAVGLGAVV